MLFDPSLLQMIQDSSTRGDELGEIARDVFDFVGIGEIAVTGGVPSTGPVLLISNHTGVFDTLVLHAVVHRADFHFVALSTYGLFGETVRRKLVPVYRVRKFNHALYEHPLCLQLTGKMPAKFSKTEVQRRNRRSITRAAELVSEGRLVSVFPTGSVGKVMGGSSWKAGVGYLVKQIDNPRVKVVFARITGTRQSDIVAYFRPALRRLLFRPRPIAVSFSEAWKLAELVDLKSDPKVLARELERRYGEWVSKTT